MIVIEFLLGWLLFDLLSGAGHWVGNSTVLERLGLDRAFANFNRDHHARPLDIVSQPYLARNITNWAGTALLALPLLFWLGPSATLAGFIAGGILVSEVHRWSHAPRTAPRLVRALQATGIIQSPKHHAGHHRPPHSVRFCLLTDWLNGPLDSLLRLR